MLSLALLLPTAQATYGDDFILDEYDWFECSRPADDTWIIRLTGGNVVLGYNDPDAPPGDRTFNMQLTGLSMPRPVEMESSEYSIYFEASPYEIDAYWSLSSNAQIPTQSLLGEFSYAWGGEWPEQIRSSFRVIGHTMRGFNKTTGYYPGSRDSFSSFCDWDDRTYPDWLPEDCFVGWSLCFSHLRPDRIVYSWTIDASKASRYKEALPNPVMMLQDASARFSPFWVDYSEVGDEVSLEYDWVDLYGVGPEGDDMVYWYWSFGETRLSTYYASDTTFDEVWETIGYERDE